MKKLWPHLKGLMAAPIDFIRQNKRLGAVENSTISYDESNTYTRCGQQNAHLIGNGSFEQRPYPKISIITPVLNGERWIRGCLENVIAQGYDGIEHIIMDGGSTDRTMAIAREVASVNSFWNHIRIFSKRDSGQSHALNKAIWLAQADYVGILNVDDFYEPGTLNRVVELIGRVNEPTMLVGNCNIWDDYGFRRISKPVLDIDVLLLGAEFPLNPSSYFYPARLHEKIGYYDEREHFTMDADFLFSALPNIRVVYFDEVWGNYRRLKGTKTFNDYVTGEGPKRLRRLYRKHYLRRPMRSKVKIAVRSVLWSMAARWRRKAMKEIV